MTDDLVVLADSYGRPCGTADRKTVHTTDTPLHFAFSCHLVDADRLLMNTPGPTFLMCGGSPNALPGQ